MVKPELSTQIRTGAAQDWRERDLSWNPGDGWPRFKNRPQGDTRHDTEEEGILEVDLPNFVSATKNDSGDPPESPDSH